MRRRMLGSVAVTCAVTWASLLSPWRGRHHHARRPANSLFEHDPIGKPVSTFPDHARRKKRAVKLGGPHRPLTFRRRGAYSIERNLEKSLLEPCSPLALEGASFWPAPPERD